MIRQDIIAALMKLDPSTLSYLPNLETEPGFFALQMAKKLSRRTPMRLGDLSPSLPLMT